MAHEMPITPSIHGETECLHISTETGVGWAREAAQSVP